MSNECQSSKSIITPSTPFSKGGLGGSKIRDLAFDLKFELGHLTFDISDYVTGLGACPSSKGEQRSISSRLSSSESFRE